MASELQIGVGEGSGPKQGLYKELRMNPYLLGLSAVCISTRSLDSVANYTQFASLGGFLFGYDQGVVSGVLTMESFGAAFPRIQQDSSFKGWLYLPCFSLLGSARLSMVPSPIVWVARVQS
jgi:hypothetical protein